MVNAGLSPRGIRNIRAGGTLQLSDSAHNQELGGIHREYLLRRQALENRFLEAKWDDDEGNYVMNGAKIVIKENYSLGKINTSGHGGHF